MIRCIACARRPGRSWWDSGFNEAITYVTVDDEDLERFTVDGVTGIAVGADPKYPIRLRNALQSERNAMRTTLIPALMRSLSENLRHEQSVRLAELSRVYLPQINDVLARGGALVGLVAAGRSESLGLGRT